MGRKPTIFSRESMSELKQLQLKIKIKKLGYLLFRDIVNAMEPYAFGFELSCHIVLQ